MIAREPFAIVPEAIARPCSDRAVRIYTLLALEAGPGGGEVRARYGQLAAQAGCSLRSVARALAELEAAEAIERATRGILLPVNRATRGTDRATRGTPASIYRERETSRARARESALARRAFELAEWPAVQTWLERIGPHYADVPEVGAAELAQAFGLEHELAADLLAGVRELRPAT